ncbi:ribonuclease E inhibitor RraB, partial [Salmonella enterica subsp. enterica serovar Lubbock]|nr:ribonuclease E inhibitor RraB [Salmonella enterica subsp. enterica serovar Lubbock]
MNDPQQGFMASFISTDAPQQWHMTEITCQLTDLAEKHGGSFDIIYGNDFYTIFALR